MRKCVVAAAVTLVASATGAMAQATSCPAGTAGTSTANAVRDACLQAADVFAFVTPQLGLALAGGNATLGQGGALGGLGHFTISLRANGFRSDLPDVPSFPAPRPQGGSAQNLPSNKQWIGLPVVDAAIGIFPGVSLGLTNVGGIDLLVSATYVPKFGDETDDVQIAPKSSTQFGFGARLGLLQESLVVPGISATYFRRDVPKTDITGRSSSVSLNINDAEVKTTAWRIVASKSLIVFGLAAGLGQDTYDAGTNVSGTISGITIPGVGTIGSTPFGPIALQQKVTRSNMFFDASANILLLKIIAEVGRTSGGDFAPLTNTFSSGAIDDARTYFSLGLRFGF